MNSGIIYNDIDLTRGIHRPRHIRRRRHIRPYCDGTCLRRKCRCRIYTVFIGKKHPVSGTGKRAHTFRAYTAASQDALDHAETATVLPAEKVSVTCGYTDLARIDKLVRDDPSVFEGGRNYGENAELILYLASGAPESFGAALGDASSGRAKMELLGETGIVTAEDRFLREYGSGEET